MAWAPDYVTADDVAAFARVDDDVDDAEYARCATTASRAIDDACNRQFGLTASEARFYTPRWSFTHSAWEVECDDLVTVTEVAVDVAGDDLFSTVIALSAVRKDPVNAPQESRPWERFRVRTSALPVPPTYPHDSVRVTGTFGWASVPTAIKEATLLQASRLAARRDSPYGVAGSPENGTEIRLLARLDPDVLTSIKDYVRRNLP
ncbi:MAG TPA: hypothetical protein VK878_23180 [Candidatus Deferrimicrobiaceae bacterium]|nr:hypothetical protein [Candidatus Deferrimicrobiaceae bacterium]